MISDDELLSDFNRRLDDWFATTHEQRAQNATMYQLRDNHHMQMAPTNDFDFDEEIKGVLSPGYKQAQRDFRSYKTPVVVNLAAAYLRAIVGLQVLNSKTIEATSVDPNFNAEHDIANDVIDYILDEGGYKSETTLVMEDAHVRGFGAAVTTLDFSFASFLGGRPSLQRKFFVAYDLAARASDLNRSAGWCAYADPVSHDQLKLYLKANGKDINNIVGGDVYSSQYMQYCRQDKQHLLDFVHHYYWYDYKNMWDVQNPYVNATQQIAEAAQAEPAVYELLGQMSDSLGIDVMAHTWTLDKDDLSEVDAFIENIREMTGVSVQKMERSERHVRHYQRAEIVGDTVIKKATSYTQKGHALNFVTGFFDETEGYHYGIMRPLSTVQVMLNDALTMYHSYVSKVEVGGVIGITGGADGIEQLIDELRHKSGIVPMPPNSQITSLGTADAAQAFMGLIELYIRLLPMPAGVSPEILSQLATKDMGEGLMQTMLQQMQTSLLHSMNGMESYMHNQGHICVDLARFMAEVGDSRVIRAISPKQGEEAYKRFSKQNLAKEYSMRLVERPISEDAQKRNFRLMVEGIQLFSEQKRDAFAPVVLENMPIDNNLKEEMKAAIAPPPVDPQMEQLAIRERVAQVEVAESGATLQKSLAMEAQSKADLSQKQGATEIQKKVSEIAENEADTQKTYAEIAKMGMEAMINQPQGTQP